MSFPFSFNANAEGGVLTEFTGSASDADSKMAARHFTYLAKRLPYPDAVPIEGAYCFHTDLSLGANDAYQLEATSAAVAVSTAAAIRFYFYAASNLTTATSDTFDLLLWQSAGPVSEFSVNVQNSAGVLKLRGGDTGGATFRSTDLITNQWHCIELVVNTGSGVNATAALFVDGFQVGATITGITCAALTQIRFGAMNIDAGTTAGHLLYDALVIDDTRVGPLTDRFSYRRRAHKSTHLALGHGHFGATGLYAADGDNTLTLWDTDRGDTSDTSKILLGPIQVTGVQSQTIAVASPTYFTKGVYAQMTGTNPRCQIEILEAPDMSLGQIKTLGVERQ